MRCAVVSHGGRQYGELRGADRRRDYTHNGALVGTHLLHRRGYRQGPQPRLGPLVTDPQPRWHAGRPPASLVQGHRWSRSHHLHHPGRQQRLHPGDAVCLDARSRGRGKSDGDEQSRERLRE